MNTSRIRRPALPWRLRPVVAGPGIDPGKLARPEGFEPPTSWFVARCSIRTKLRARGKKGGSYRIRGASQMAVRVQ